MECWQPFGRPVVPLVYIRNSGASAGSDTGATRDGGSYDDRMGNVACWNAVMDENDYMVRKWNEFIAS